MNAFLLSVNKLINMHHFKWIFNKRKRKTAFKVRHAHSNRRNDMNDVQILQTKLYFHFKCFSNHSFFTRSKLFIGYSNFTSKLQLWFSKVFFLFLFIDIFDLSHFNPLEYQPQFQIWFLIICTEAFLTIWY